MLKHLTDPHNPHRSAFPESLDGSEHGPEHCPRLWGVRLGADGAAAWGPGAPGGAAAWFLVAFGVDQLLKTITLQIPPVAREPSTLQQALLSPSKQAEKSGKT